MERVIGASRDALPDEMLKFVLLNTSRSESAARLGQLTLRARPPISTPHYIVPTSRGVIPHLSQDNLQKHTRISAIYVPLEDCTYLFSASGPIADLHGLQLVAE